jgi:hypothetical protein
MQKRALLEWFLDRYIDLWFTLWMNHDSHPCSSCLIVDGRLVQLIPIWLSCNFLSEL